MYNIFILIIFFIALDKITEYAKIPNDNHKTLTHVNRTITKTTFYHYLLFILN